MNVFMLFTEEALAQYVGREIWRRGGKPTNEVITTPGLGLSRRRQDPPRLFGTAVGPAREINLGRHKVTHLALKGPARDIVARNSPQLVMAEQAMNLEQQTATFRNSACLITSYTTKSLQTASMAPLANCLPYKLTRAEMTNCEVYVCMLLCRTKSCLIARALGEAIAQWSQVPYRIPFKEFRL